MHRAEPTKNTSNLQTKDLKAGGRILRGFSVSAATIDMYSGPVMLRTVSGRARYMNLFRKHLRKTCLVQARKYQGARLMLGKARERANVGDNNFAKRMSEFDDLEKEIVLSEQLAFRHLQTNGGAFVASSSGPPASPFSKIPWELTVAIFKEVTAVPHGAPHDVIPSGPSGSSALIQLTAVCRHWRAIAHTVPSLWNRLVLTKLHPEKKAQLWIGRARGQIRQIVIKSSFFQTLDTLRYSHSAQSPEDYLTKTVLKGVLWDGIMKGFLGSVGCRRFNALY